MSGRVSTIFAAMVVSLLVSAPGTARATQCADVQCGDVDASGKIVASDAMRLLRKAVGQDVEVTCPYACLETTTTTTTTTTLEPVSCAITFRVADEVDLLGLQFEVDYSGAAGQFPGEGRDVSCTNLTPIYGAAYDDGDGDVLTVLFASPELTMNGPLNVMTCEFEGSNPVATDFAVTFQDALREEDVLGGGGTGVCGAPVTGLLGPTVRDYTYVLKIAAGVLGTCPLCECDVNNSGSVTGSDALVVRMVAGGEPFELNCPACGYPPAVGFVGDPVSIEVSVGCF